MGPCTKYTLTLIHTNTSSQPPRPQHIQPSETETHNPAMATQYSAPFTTSIPPIPRNQIAVITTADPRPTPTHGPGGSFSIITSCSIAAPPETVASAILDHAAYSEWNTWIPRCTVESPSPSSANNTAENSPFNDPQYIQPGAKLTIEVHLDPARSWTTTNQNLEVTVLEPYDHSSANGWRVAWKATSHPSYLLRAERVQEMVDDGHGGTEYTCWETMYGPLASVVRLATGAMLEKGFQRFGADLKKRAEALAAAGGA